MRRPPLALAGLALACLFSCSLVESQELAPPPPVPRALSEPCGPSAVEFVEARFHSYYAGLSRAELRAVAQVIVAEARRNELSWELVLAVIHTESRFQNFAVSHVGALGLMQIMPATGEALATELDIPWRGPQMLFQPKVNVRLGTRYLARLHDRYGEWDKALAAYNWGPARIDWRLRRGRAMPVRYAHAVLDRLQSRARP